MPTVLKLKSKISSFNLNMIKIVSSNHNKVIKDFLHEKLKANVKINEDARFLDRVFSGCTEESIVAYINGSNFSEQEKQYLNDFVIHFKFIGIDCVTQTIKELLKNKDEEGLIKEIKSWEPLVLYRVLQNNFKKRNPPWGCAFLEIMKKHLLFKNFPPFFYYEKRNLLSILNVSIFLQNKNLVQAVLEGGGNEYINELAAKESLPNRKTPLMMSGHFYPTVFNLLIKHGANTYLKDDEGNNVFLKSGLRHPNILKKLLKMREDINQIDKHGQNLLHQIYFSEYNNPLLLLKLLIQKGCNIHHKDKRGETPLRHLVTANNYYNVNTGQLIHPQNKLHLEMMKVLMEAGADIYEADNNGIDGLTGLCAANPPFVIDLLINGIPLYDKEGIHIIEKINKYASQIQKSENARYIQTVLPVLEVSFNFINDFENGQKLKEDLFLKIQNKNVMNSIQNNIKIVQKVL